MCTLSSILLSLSLSPGNLAAQEEEFELEAAWGPMVSSTYGIPAEEEFSSILDPGPAEPWGTYLWEDVARLLPADPSVLESGKVWPIDVEAVLVFLRQLHASATGELHHHVFDLNLDDLPPGVTLVSTREGERRVDALRAEGVSVVKSTSPGAPLGAYGTLLGSGDGVLDVLLRAHAEFVLADGHVTYTPAQFEGRLVVEPEAHRVRYFRLAVPDRNTNVDINVEGAAVPAGGGPGQTAWRADIGYVKELSLTTPSDPEADPPGMSGARERLRAAFYPFAAIAWKPLAEAWAASRASGRPLHVIQLFGTLDDESC